MGHRRSGVRHYQRPILEELTRGLGWGLKGWPQEGGSLSRRADQRLLLALLMLMTRESLRGGHSRCVANMSGFRRGTNS